MKNILIPIDFSECSMEALHAGIQFARRFGSQLYLLNSQDLPPYWDNLPPAEKKKWTTANEAVQKASERLTRLKEQNPGLAIETVATGKALPQAVRQCVESHGIDLIIMGSHGASGKSEFFIGSNTQKVIRTVHCPTLVLKRRLEKPAFGKVVFASNFREEEMESFIYFKKIIKPFLPDIHLVYIQHSFLHPPQTVQLEAMKPFVRACSPLRCHTHIYPDLSVDSGIRSFASIMGANLIAISYHIRHPLKRMLIGSKVEAIINHAQIPLLTIDFDNKT